VRSRRRWLVEQQDFGPHRHGARYGGAFLLAEGQHMRRAVRQIGDAERGQGLIDALPRLPSLKPRLSGPNETSSATEAANN